MTVDELLPPLCPAVNGRARCVRSEHVDGPHRSWIRGELQDWL